MKKIIKKSYYDITRCCIILSCKDVFKKSPQNMSHFKKFPKDKSPYVYFKALVIMINECF